MNEGSNQAIFLENRPEMVSDLPQNETGEYSEWPAEAQQEEMVSASKGPRSILPSSPAESAENRLRTATGIMFRWPCYNAY